MSDYVVHMDRLVKYYDGRRVLDDINLRIPQGCVYGLLGRNGVGKTTLIRILLGLETLTRGSSLVFGKSSWSLSPCDRGRIGYVAEGHNLLQHYRVGRLVQLCRDLALRWDADFFDRLMNTFRLPMDRRVKELSAGMRAQLNLALAMAIDPEFLILDDPTLGLDTVARRQFLELSIDLIQRPGRTILFCSHILGDVERIAERIGVLLAGKLVVDCSLEQLKDRIIKLRVIFSDNVPVAIDITEIIRQQRRDRELILTVANWSDQKQSMLETYGPSEISRIPMSLEDIFIECTNPAGLPVAI